MVVVYSAQADHTREQSSRFFMPVIGKKYLHTAVVRLAPADRMQLASVILEALACGATFSQTEQVRWQLEAVGSGWNRRVGGWKRSHVGQPVRRGASPGLADRTGAR